MLTLKIKQLLDSLASCKENMKKSRAVQDLHNTVQSSSFLKTGWSWHNGWVTFAYYYLLFTNTEVMNVLYV